MKHRSTLPRQLANFAEIAPQYSALLCDVWGVLHNGVAPFDGVNEALQNYRAQGGKVLLLSNAPRPAAAVAQRIADIGIKTDTYDAILTSGDAARDMLATRGAAGQKGFFLGPDKDADLTAGLDAHLVDIEAAEFVLLTGPYDDTHETPADYLPRMRDWQARGLPLLCANPDRTVQMGDRVIYCGGALAEAYEELGGEVVWLGKPFAPIYARAETMLASMGVQGQVLAVGDGMKTDMPGANAAGIDALFITGGLAAASPEGAPETPVAAAALLATENAHAQYFMRHLVW